MRTPPLATPAAQPVSAPAQVVKPQADVVHISVYIPRAAYERLRDVAFVERLKMQDLLNAFMPAAGPRIR